MRVYAVDVTGAFHDIRDLDDPAGYDPEHYETAQAFGAHLRNAGSGGIVYRSGRGPGGECVAVLKPRRLSRCRTDRRLTYRWDGTRISVVYEKRALTRP